jgi:hypothetical protein
LQLVCDERVMLLCAVSPEMLEADLAAGRITSRRGGLSR